MELEEAAPEISAEEAPAQEVSAAEEVEAMPELVAIAAQIPDEDDIATQDIPLAENGMPELTTTPELDELDLEAILRAAFSDQADQEEAQDSNLLSDDTILLEDLSQATATAEEPEAEEESAEADAEDPDTNDEQEEVEDTPQMKKRRPKNPHAYGFFGIPHMVTTVIWLALVVFIGAGLGRMIWQVAADMLAFGREDQAVTITISSEDDLDAITDKLYDTGLIEYKSVFKFYGKLAKAEQKIKPGTYHLNTIYDYNALVKKMSSYAARATTKVVLPEGYTCAQIFQLLEEAGVCKAADLENAAMNADLSKYWFLEGVDRSSPNCLEGYLFPDTYEFYLDYEPELVLAKLLRNFDVRFSDAMQEKLDALNLTLADMMRSHGLPESYIESHRITIRELVIIASMIEKETSGNEESYYIASVIYNRLTNPGEYPYLNIDATLVYVVGHSPLTQEDLALDSPYNTYLYKGLVPGPIANPGVASLNAALSPESTEYYFYALNPSTGSHEFFKTYKAHQNFLESLKKGGK